MPTPRAPWTAKVLELLADGRWHTVDELVDAASPLVPPGRAAREAERCRVAQQLDRTGTTTPRIFDRGDPHASGARRLVVSSLWGLSRRAVIEHDQPRALYRLARSAR